MIYRAKQMLEKARQSKHGSHPAVLSRWYNQEEYRKSLAEHNIGEKEVMLFDRIALERHEYTATKAEQLRNAKHWILRLRADGPQKPLRQRPEFALALKQCLKMQDSRLAETLQSHRPICPEHQQRQREDEQSEGGETFDYCVDRKNWMAVLQRATEKPRRQRLHLRHRSGKAHSVKRVGAHGSLLHLRNGGNFGFLEGIPENRRCA